MSEKCFELHSDFKPAGDQPAAIDALVRHLQDGTAYQTLLGVTGSGKTFTMANVIQTVHRPALILAPNKTLAAQIYGEMKAFFPKNAVEYFVSYYDYYQPEAYVPSSDTYIAKDASINDHVEQMRLSATKAILERRDVVIVATVSAIYGLGDPRMYLKMVIHLSRGEVIDQRTLLRRLAELQYVRNDTDFRRGTYRVRGDVIDVFPADSDKEAIRIQLFENEVEQLSFFDPLTQKTSAQVPRLTIYPKTHYVTARETIYQSMDAIKADLRDRLEELYAASKLVEAQRLEQRTLYDLEMMQEVGYCSGIENYSRYLSGRAPGEPPPTLFDYVPKDAVLIIDESHVTVPQLHAMYRGDRARKETLVNYGFRLPSALDNRPLMFDEFIARAPQTIYVSATPSAYELAQSHGTIAEQVVRPTGLLDPRVEIRPVASQVDDVMSEIHEAAKRHERVLITTLTKRMAEELTEYLSDHGVRVRYLHSDVGTVERVEIIRSLRLGEFDALIGINLLREGLDLPEVSLVAILDADKEGFLRSTTSLIQTIGRVARHVNGRAILYADKITDSMQRAIDETARRRIKQADYNKAHGITPKSIAKAVHDIMEAAYASDSVRGKLFGGGAPLSSKSKKETHDMEWMHDTAEQLTKRIARMEKAMYEAAHDLNFEEAARLRDVISEMTDALRAR